jgi:U6 snRNA-associated Sm-like protein LSm1
MVWLRDGRVLVGYLRSYDQFANLVLHDTIERLTISDKKYYITVGVFLVRGENVVMVGEAVEDETIEEASQEWITEKRREQISEKLERKKERDIVLARLGFCVESVEGDAY